MDYRSDDYETKIYPTIFHRPLTKFITALLIASILTGVGYKFSPNREDKNSLSLMIFILILVFIWMILEMSLRPIEYPKQEWILNDKIYHDVPVGGISFDKYDNQNVRLIALQFKENGPLTLYATRDLLNNDVIDDEDLFIHSQEYKNLPKFIMYSKTKLEPSKAYQTKEKEFDFYRLLPDGKLDKKKYVMRLQVVVD